MLPYLNQSCGCTAHRHSDGPAFSSTLFLISCFRGNLTSFIHLQRSDLSVWVQLSRPSSFQIKSFHFLQTDTEHSWTAEQNPQGVLHGGEPGSLSQGVEAKVKLMDSQLSCIIHG
ncbi:hypothetical protein XENORESO_011911 [Xenotaenia resolanae]|uniref:Uncharacterized protein n=1 Tax=Xenotaenia resolanae TaxID=208358 RepID=A0ABV0WN82_9TELE